MKYRAVIFDLYGTLVDELRYPHRQEVKYQRWVSDTAAALELPVDDFRRVWADTSRQREEGEIRTRKAILAFLCDTLDVDVSDEQLNRAAAIALEYIRRALKPRNGVVETLARLHDEGIKTGLISNCLAETSELWSSTPFPSLLDASILSCEVGMMKPNPGIYRLACERLRVEPRDCLFIGDGGSGELTGATNVGMDAVLIRAPNDTENGNREDWQGIRISSVEEVLSLVE